MSDAETPANELELYERHRALVRETDKKFSTVYGAGGAAVLGVGALVLIAAGAFGALGTVLPWVLAITAVFISLFVLASVVRRKRDRLKEQVMLYCELNELDWEELRDYYDGEGLYPYFVSLLSPAPRRTQ